MEMRRCTSCCQKVTSLMLSPVTKRLAHNYPTFWCRENVVFMFLAIYWKCSLKWCYNRSSTSSVWVKVASRDVKVAVLSLAIAIWCRGCQRLFQCAGRLLILIEAVKKTAMTSFLPRHDFGNVDKLGDEPEFLHLRFCGFTRTSYCKILLSSWPQSAVILR